MSSKFCVVCKRQIRRNSNDNQGCICKDPQCEAMRAIQNDFVDDTHYVLPQDYNNIVANDIPNYDKSLSILHFNCRSLKRNFDNFVCTLSSFSHPFSIIALSETWLNDKETISMDGYVFVGQGRPDKRGGGVGFFIKDTIKFKRRTDMDVFNETVEMLFIEIYSKHKKIILAIVYRPPNQEVSEFLNVLEVPLLKITNENRECLLIGDYNIDLLNATVSPNTDKFIDLLLTYSFTPFILKPTRFSRTSATLIDNIFSNRPENNLNAGIMVMMSVITYLYFHVLYVRRILMNIIELLKNVTSIMITFQHFAKC